MKKRGGPPSDPNRPALSGQNSLDMSDTIGRRSTDRLGRREFCQRTLVAMVGAAFHGASSKVNASFATENNEAVVPSLDELGSLWLDCSQLAHMPSLHNFQNMAACAPDLAGVNFWPGGQLYSGSGPRWYQYHTLPLCQLFVDGKSYDAETCRWYAYEAVRRTNASGLEIVTTTRLAPEESQILWRVVFHNSGKEKISFNIALRIPGKHSQTGKTRIADYVEPTQQLHSRYVLVDIPENLQPSAETVDAEWQLSLEPGQSRELRFTMKVTGAGSGFENESNPVQDFDRRWSAAKKVWEDRWAAAFAPHNTLFSGNAPVLITGDNFIREIYYRSILTLLVLLRTNLWCNRTFVTSGERAEGTVYYWDTSLFSTVLALLEPRGMKEQIEFFLEQDPHADNAIVIGRQRPQSPKVVRLLPGWDLTGYAANDLSIFRLTETYIAVNADSSFLNDKIADQTVIGHLEGLATNWKKLIRDGDRLADYGEAPNLLECVPTYIHRVPSFNAASVWMMRKLAVIVENQGDAEKAAKLRSEATALAGEVMTLYLPGTGYWSSLHRDGTRVEMRHCYDFATVGRLMCEDLPERVKKEMLKFVQDELLMKSWMRAQSLKDVAAADSDRPDHGPMGAYDAWPAVTVDAMCYLGAWPEAIDFLRRTQAAIYEGVYAQAREFYGPRRKQFDAPVRIAQREGCMRECSGGGAFAESIITTLFGYSPQAETKPKILFPRVSRGFIGELRHVRQGSDFYTIRSHANGVSLEQES
jgi:hypothetical protein